MVSSTSKNAFTSLTAHRGYFATGRAVHGRLQPTGKRKKSRKFDVLVKIRRGRNYERHSYLKKNGCWRREELTKDKSLIRAATEQLNTSVMDN